ncbi:MAG: bifunctional diguanylate cyclase/phosphodiesterase [Rhodobacteraceae bacterium]|nr:bifunctional diguanylate cyclase/phosphodiesterase [Paracoccaceae bacterium]
MPDALLAAMRIALRSRHADVIALGPALLLAWLFFGDRGGMVALAAALPIVFLSRTRDRLRAATMLDPRRDDVTGLPPRQAVIAALDRALELAEIGGRKSACIVISIDEPQSILDNYGQAAHDRVLQKTGERISALLRETDLVARLEGARFALALTPAHRLDLEAAIQIAIRLKTAVAEPLSIDAMTVYLSASVGFCLTGRAPQKTGQAILGAAELALEDARRSGPGAIRGYSPEIAQAAHERDDLRDRIEAALENGEIAAYFQPQLSTDTGDVTGFEALARWVHPERGLLAPAEFLPTIIGSGLSERLGETMLVQALTALRSWDKDGLDIPAVSINLSKDELRNPTLAAKVAWELDRFDIKAGRLTIEILESVVATAENDIVVKNISALSELGCRIDLDDFGTGHASIANIRRFSVDRIKIDRSFVTRADTEQSQQQIVAAVLSMAERLGLDTLAEGVETIGEHAILAQLGCTHVQGFAIAHPMPFAATKDWLIRHRTKLGSAPRVNKRMG